jgi:hypothetical protein
VANIKIRREDIIEAFALNEFLEDVQKPQQQKGAAAGGSRNGGGTGGSTKKRR